MTVDSRCLALIDASTRHDGDDDGDHLGMAQGDTRDHYHRHPHYRRYHHRHCHVHDARTSGVSQYRSTCPRRMNQVCGSGLGGGIGFDFDPSYMIAVSLEHRSYFPLCHRHHHCCFGQLHCFFELSAVLTASSYFRTFADWFRLFAYSCRSAAASSPSTGPGSGRLRPFHGSPVGRLDPSELGLTLHQWYD